MRKNLRRNLSCTLAVFALCMFQASCNKDAEPGNPHDPSKPLEVKSIEPRDGGVREKLLIKGTNFGNDPRRIKVFFNQTEAPVIGANDTMIYARVPRLPGDRCVIKVVIGDNEATSPDTFAYFTTAVVSTITGNGTQAYRGGTLAQGQVYARYIAVDAQDNIFASVRDASNFALVRINEHENIVQELIHNTSNATLNPNSPAVDLATGIVTVPHDGSTTVYYTFDPRDGWTPRMNSLVYDPADQALVEPEHYRYATAYCAYDNCVYSRYRNGWIVKMDAVTKEAELVFKTSNGAGYGLAFSTLEPWKLYVPFHNESVHGNNANNIGTLDVREPISDDSWKIITSGVPTAGHRDGPIAQARFSSPRQLCFDPDGNLFIADFGNHCIRMMSPDGIVETILGMPGTSGYQDGGKSEALFNQPWGLAVGVDGTVYVSDYGNARIRKLTIE